MAATELSGEYDIYPVDSRGGSVMMGFMCKEAREIDREGKGINQILDRLNYIRDHTEIILTLKTLEYARMSGRVKAMQAALASLLNVKPIVILNDGMLNVTERVRTRGRSIERVIERMRERIGSKLVNIAVVHAQDPEVGFKVMDRVKNIFNIKELIFSELSTGIAANLGPGTVGIIAYPVSGG
jgi:DegV family protein with EDD domain